MERLTIGILAFPILFALLVIRVPIGLAMLTVGALGTAAIAGCGACDIALRAGVCFSCVVLVEIVLVAVAQLARDGLVGLGFCSAGR